MSGELEHRHEAGLIVYDLSAAPAPDNWWPDLRLTADGAPFGPEWTDLRSYEVAPCLVCGEVPTHLGHFALPQPRELDLLGFQTKPSYSATTYAQLLFHCFHRVYRYRVTARISRSTGHIERSVVWER